MIIIKLQGGLGNQLFQYATGKAISLRTSLPVVYDVEAYKPDAEDTSKLQSALKTGLLQKHTLRPLGLTHFNLVLKEATLEDLAPHLTSFQVLYRKIKARLVHKNWYAVDKHIYTPTDNSYLQGWWQTDLYFKEYADILRKDFTLKHPFGVSAQSIYLSMKEFRLPGFSSVSLHIRRGDYISNSHAAAHHGVLDISYYEQALHIIEEKIQKRLHLFIFSDDIDWARQHIQTDHSVSFVSSPDIQDYEEILLMSHCDHNIIANSTFSWWGAWLNPSSEKIVIAPKKWILDATISTDNALPDEWIRI